MSGLNLRNLLPLQAKIRMGYYQSVNEIGAKRIASLERKHEPFLMFDEDNNAMLDWEFITLEASTKQFEDLLENFVVTKFRK